MLGRTATVGHADTGEIIRQLTLDYQPQNSTKPPNP